MRRIWIILLLFCSWAYAINDLSVIAEGLYGSRACYIDEATLVVQPHGGYVEESLYLVYSDHQAYEAGRQIEMVHRFELPPGAVVNDLWLWIGDSVMQAIVIDTWTARAIYDSIVSFKRDPAFLTKNGTQYELRIYPMLSGGSRKIKMNFIVPTQWRGEQANALLPLRMLQVNHGQTTPLRVWFRERQGIWGDPQIEEFPTLSFKPAADTLGYHFRSADLADISALSSLTMQFGVSFLDGYFYDCQKMEDGSSYYQMGILPRTFFNLNQDTTWHRVLVALDLNLPPGEKPESYIEPITKVIKSAVRPGDSLQGVVTGAGEMTPLTGRWLNGDSLEITAMMNSLRGLPLWEKLAMQTAPHILYADRLSLQCWTFPGLEGLSTRENIKDIISAIPRFSSADIIAAYEHGHEQPLSDSQLLQVVAGLEPFFARGGRLLTFYDYNRVNKEKLATYYISGLNDIEQKNGTLYRNPQGAVGRGFPVSFHHPIANILTYQDSSVVKEVVDGDGRAVVISKRIGNGLLVVSGIWSFQDDAALRAQMGTPLLGLQQLMQHQQLPQLLENIHTFCASQRVDEVLLFTASDSLLDRIAAAAWSKAYLQDFSPAVPVMHSVNLLDGLRYQPLSLTDKDLLYYGSGYWMKELSEQSGGIHFERQRHDWNYIRSTLAAESYPARQSLQMSVTVDGGAGSSEAPREVMPVPGDYGKPVFWTGAVTGLNSIVFDFEAQFAGLEVMQKQKVMPIQHDSTRLDRAAPTVYGAEIVRERLETAAYDTAWIVDTATKFHLLCDYTALIALEPDQKHHFMKRPFDESEYPVLVQVEDAKTDSSQLSIYPNPFNSRAALEVQVARPSRVTLIVYNVRGQVVRTLLNDEWVDRTRQVFWDGDNQLGNRVSSGLYLVRFSAGTGANARHHVQRILLVR